MTSIQSIKLIRGEWLFDPGKPLGKAGGFGAVFAGHSDVYGELAVKRLHLSANDAAHREMRIADNLAGRDLHHVIPVFDAGEDPDTGAYYVVMPRAERSLQESVESEGNFGDLKTAEALLAILDGLSEVPEIVHRDLKPPNVLTHAGQWKVADFGIARFVEETTSLRTLKDCLSPQYAAPEQWQYLKATAATDIYALGCIAYALLTGKPPFDGATVDELRKKHITSDPPLLNGVRPQLQTLLTMMLRKPPEARPSRDRARQILTALIARARSTAPAPAAYEALAVADAQVARAAAVADRKAVENRSEEEQREALGTAGLKILKDIFDALFARIRNEAQMTKGQAPEFRVTLGKGRLDATFGKMRAPILPANLFADSKWDVVLGEAIRLRQEDPHYEWSASLWYGKLPGTEQYRWYECSYFAPLKRQPDPFAPYDLKGKEHDADLAA